MARLGNDILDRASAFERTPVRPAHRPSTVGSGSARSDCLEDTAPRPRRRALTPVSGGGRRAGGGANNGLESDGNGNGVSSAPFMQGAPAPVTPPGRVEQMGFSWDHGERGTSANGEVVAVPLLTGPDNAAIIEAALEEVEAGAAQRRRAEGATKRGSEASVRGNSGSKLQSLSPQPSPTQQERAAVGRGGGIVTVNVETGKSTFRTSMPVTLAPPRTSPGPCSQAPCIKLTSRSSWATSVA